MQSKNTRNTTTSIALSPEIRAELHRRARTWAAKFGIQDERGSLGTFLRWAGMNVVIPEFSQEVRPTNTSTTGASDYQTDPERTLSQ